MNIIPLLVLPLLVLFSIFGYMFNLEAYEHLTGNDKDTKLKFILWLVPIINGVFALFIFCYALVCVIKITVKGTPTIFKATIKKFNKLPWK